MGGVTDADLDRAFDAGAFIRTHVLRPTWHFVAPEDLRWLLALTAPRVHQASGYQYRQLGLDPETRARGRAVIERALRDRQYKTREELGRALDEAGLEATGLRLGYFCGDAELEALICNGPRRGKRQTYALVEEWVPPAPARTREEALAEIARRYVEGHGPAQVADLSWWSGLTVADSRAALASASPPLVRETVGEKEYWISPASPGRSAAPLEPPHVRLLPNYDELLIAFRDRVDAVDPGLPPPKRVAEVILAHVITRDGLVVGGWRRVGEGQGVRLILDVLVPLDDPERAALGGEIRRFEAFLGRPVEVTGLD